MHELGTSTIYLRRKGKCCVSVSECFQHNEFGSMPYALQCFALKLLALPCCKFDHEPCD